MNYLGSGCSKRFIYDRACCTTVHWVCDDPHEDHWEWETLKYPTRGKIILSCKLHDGFGALLLAFVGVSQVVVIGIVHPEQASIGVLYRRAKRLHYEDQKGAIRGRYIFV